MEKILSAAKAEKLRTGENPAAWHDHLVNILPKGGHHAALPYELAPAFWKSLRQDASMGSQALQFIMLTGVRFNVAIPAVRRNQISIRRSGAFHGSVKMDEE
jgi:hypothetical protein